jgi:cytidine deaminase
VCLHLAVDRPGSEPLRTVCQSAISLIAPLPESGRHALRTTDIPDGVRYACERNGRTTHLMPKPDQSLDARSRADESLIAEALTARQRAYAPYSKFAVGAAVRTVSGTVFHGCNVENAAYGHAMCAERVAMFAAIAAGGGPVTEIAVVADSPVPVTPCGACRQVIVELAPDARVIMANVRGERHAMTAEALLPAAFALPRDPATG